MTYFRLAFGIGLSLSMGYFLADIVLRQIRTRSWLIPWLGIGIGLGLSSLTYFTWLIISGPAGWAYFFGEIALAAGLGLAWFRSSRGVKETELLAPPSDQARLPVRWSWLLNVSLVLTIILAGLTYIFGTLVFPHGGWDAWAIWNLAARFLFMAGKDWKLLFAPSIFHSDYPLLLGSNVARLWTYRSVVDFIAPAVIGFLFSLATLGLLITLANLSHGAISSRLAGLALLSSSTILVIAPTQCADLPLGYYLLGALGCLSLYQKYSKSGFLIMTGVLLGFGIWTKNEGWLLAVTVLVGWVTTMILFERRSFSVKHFLRQASWLLIGLIPLTVFSLIQKMVLAPTNDLIAGQGVGTLDRFADPARWVEIGRRFTIMLFSLEPKYSAPLGLLVALAIIFGLREKAFSDPRFGSTSSR